MKAPSTRLPGARTAPTVGQLIARGARRLAASRVAYGHGTASAREDAAFLVACGLGLDPDRLSLDERLTPERTAAILGLFERRVKERRPAAYLARKAWLAGLDFYVDERVIVPRSHLAGLIHERLAPWVAHPRRVRAALDLCTGSGCLAVMLARAFPLAVVDAAEISPAAVLVARINARRHRLSRRIRIIESDLFSALRGRRYDLIVSNPPYVTARAMRRLPREYRHEPRLALAGGRDGLALVRDIVGRARNFLNPGGLLVVEVGAGRRRVERAFPRAEFSWPELETGKPVFIATRDQLPG